MNTITHNNYGCAALHAQECETLSAGFCPVVWKIITYALVAFDVIELVESPPDFTAGISEGFEAGRQAARNR